MKKLLMLMLAVQLLSCSGNEAKNEVEVTQEPAAAEPGLEDVPTSDKETSVELTFESGMLKGTHLFVPDNENRMSQVNVGFSDGVSNLNATGLISMDGKYRLLINRPFMGEASAGDHAAKKYTNDCGVFIITPLGSESEFTRIDGSYQNCTKTKVTGVGEWSEGTVYNRRGVTATYSDLIQMEITLTNGTPKSEQTTITVSFKARESRIK